MPFRYKYIQPLGEEHYSVSYDNEDNYYDTIIDRHGNVMIPASKQYRSIYNFHNHVAIANQNCKWGLIDDSGNHIGNFDYNFVAEWGDGYYKVEKGSKRNIMRPDGSLVLQDWYNDVFKVSNGYFEFGNTIRKSKTNPETRYIRGVAHVNGDILFPMIFEHVRRLDNDAFYAEIGTKPYILTSHHSLKALPIGCCQDFSSSIEIPMPQSTQHVFIVLVTPFVPVSLWMPRQSC